MLKYFEEKSIVISSIIHIIVVLSVFISAQIKIPIKPIEQKTLVIEMLKPNIDTNIKIKTGSAQDTSDKAFKLDIRKKPSSVKSKDVSNKSSLQDMPPLTHSPDANKMPMPEVKASDKDKSVSSPEYKSKPSRTKKKIEDDSEFSSLLKSIRKQKHNSAFEINNNEDGIKGLGEMDYDTRKEMTQNLSDSIHSQIMSNWNIPIKLVNLTDLSVKLIVKFDRDAFVLSIEIYNGKNTNDPSLRTLIESAKRAIYSSSPFEGIEKYPYEMWEEIAINFDPSDVL